MKFELIEQAPNKKDSVISIKEEITETKEIGRFTIAQLEAEIEKINQEIDGLKTQKTAKESLLKECVKYLN